MQVQLRFLYDDLCKNPNLILTADVSDFLGDNVKIKGDKQTIFDFGDFVCLFLKFHVFAFLPSPVTKIDFK